MTITSIISGIFNILLGSQLHVRWAPYWFTAFVIYAYSFVYNLGAAVVPFVLTAEVFLPEVTSKFLFYISDKVKELKLCIAFIQ